MKSRRYQKIGVLFLGALGLFFTIGVAVPASAGMTAILMKGGKTSEIQDVQMVFRYKDTREIKGNKWDGSIYLTS